MIDTVLDRLHKVRKTGTDRWVACCPAHADQSPSLSIRALVDGRILLHCFAGCETHDVLEKLGLTFDALFPKKGAYGNFERAQRPFNAIDVLRCVAYEAHIAAVAASNLAHGMMLEESDRARLTLAASRLHRAVEVAEDA